MGEHRVEILPDMTIEWDVPIPMDDGVVLRADVFRPIGTGRHPVIMTHGPYGKNLSFSQGWPTQFNALTTAWPEVLERSSGRFHVWETVDPEKWVPEGYVCLRVDARGSGQSPGYLNPFSPREIDDYAACIEWAGVQDWSDGKVGLNGISYYARRASRVIWRRSVPGRARPISTAIRRATAGCFRHSGRPLRRGRSGASSMAWASVVSSAS